MDTISPIQAADVIRVGTSALGRFAAQPKSFATTAFKSALAGVNALADAVTGSGTTGLNSDYADLIQMQIETQKQMFLTSMYSNIEKSKHETQMAAVRNVRVG